MKRTPASKNNRVDHIDSPNLNDHDQTGLVDRDSPQSAQLKPSKKTLVSIWTGLGIVIIGAIIPGEYIQTTFTYLNIDNIRISASKILGTSDLPALAKGDACIAQNPVQDAQVALSLSQVHLAQANTNLQKFQSDYSHHKTLASQDKVTPKQLQAAKTAYDLAQLQKSSALKGLQQAQVQVAAVRVENC